MLFDAHTRCLTGVGGVASRGIYDNMKTAVDRTPRKDRGRVINARFAAMVAHYLFEPDFCNVASGWEKGRVEKGVQDARRQIWQDAAAERFDTFAALNAWLATRCRTAWDAPHPELHGLTIYDAWLQERPHLMPMPTPFDGYVELSGQRVLSLSAQQPDGQGPDQVPGAGARQIPGGVNRDDVTGVESLSVGGSARRRFALVNFR